MKESSKALRARWDEALTGDMIKDGFRVPILENGMADYRGVQFGRPFFEVGTIAEADFSHSTQDHLISKVEFDRCLFDKAKFTGPINAEFRNCRFKGARFGPLYWFGSVADCLFDGVTFQRIISTDDGLTFTRVKFSNCKFVYASLSELDFVDCVFEDCQFSMCAFPNNRFINCKISRDDLGDTILNGAVFS